MYLHMRKMSALFVTGALGLSLEYGSKERSDALSFPSSHAGHIDSSNFRYAQGVRRQHGHVLKSDVGPILSHRFVTADAVERNVSCVSGRSRSTMARDRDDIRGIIHHAYLYVLT